VLAALLIGLSLWLWSRYGLPQDPRPPFEPSLSDFYFIVGGGRLQDGELRVNSFDEGRAILGYSLREIDAKDYRYLTYDPGAFPLGDESPVFFWRLEGSRETHSVSIYNGGFGVLDLHRLPHWRGVVGEIGVVFSGQDGQVFPLRALRLEADAADLRLLALLSQWFSGEAWSQRSAHFLVGGARDTYVPLPLLLLGWVVLAGALLALFQKRRATAVTVTPLLILLLLAWLLLDSRWLLNLVRNTSDGFQRFYGRDDPGRILATLDRDYFALYQYILGKYLPPEPTRIDVLYGAEIDRKYYASKAPYYLAPHMVSLPTTGRARFSNDVRWILVLGGVEGLRFDARARRLTLVSGHSIAAKRVMRSKLGTLFRVL